MTDDRKPSGRRRSLTPRQLATEAGAELLELCQTVTEDGRLSDPEVDALRQWLTDHQEVDLPARAHLVAIVEQVVADGQVTPTERRELYRAIESVLPPDLRDLARLKRRTAEDEDRAEARAEREAERAAAKAARVRDRPVASFNFMTAGVRYENRERAIRAHAEEAVPVLLVRDPGNRHSRNAIEIQVRNGAQLGYVPEELAREIAPLLDRGHPYRAMITKMLRGARVPIPVVQVWIHREDADVDDLVRPSAAAPSGDAAPARQAPSPPPVQGSGCLSAVALAVAALLGLLA